ncbi:VOC family protein [Marinactinospora rubrisoli]|uniref:VOC family protein n=1 Tax=Marinactinospora rubrisoli TaxID=2715399 RepID=A0ABW2KHY4_9ACTN
MSFTSRYPPGAPAWFDMTVPDLRTAERFYSELLGWEFDLGPYALAGVAGRRVAALTETWNEETGPPDRPCWTTYLATDDVGATLHDATAAGGTVLTQRRDVPGFGSMAVVREPAGTVVALWEGDGLTGSEGFGMLGGHVWAEVTSPDTEVTAEFLVRTFGYRPERFPGFDFVTLYVGGTAVCGVYGGAERVNEGPGAWLPYFAVASADVAADRAARSGGRVLRAPADSPYGRWTMLADPFGAHFAASEPEPRPH